MKAAGRNTFLQTGNPTAIETAFDELTPKAFAVWVRLMLLDDEQLKMGRRRVTEIIGYSERQGNVILSELRDKGYIKIIKGPYPSFPSAIELSRKAMLASRSHFIKLANMLCSHMQAADIKSHTMLSQSVWGVAQYMPTHATTSRQYTNNDEKHSKNQNEERKQPTFSSTFSTQQVHKKSTKMKVVDELEIELSLQQKLSHVGPAQQENSENQNSDDAISIKCTGISAHRLNSTPGLASTSDLTKYRKKCTQPTVGTVEKVSAHSDEKKVAAYYSLVSSTSSKESQEKVTTETAKGDIENAVSKSKKQVDINKALRLWKQGKEQSRKNRLKAGEQRPKVPHVYLDWDKVDMRGNPAISFTLNDTDRAKMVAILELPAHDLRRIRLSNKLGAEFMRIYCAYRRQIEIKYITSPRERKYANTAGELCIYKRMVPHNYIEFWHYRIGEFTGMKYPSLNFLASAANADTAACSMIGMKASARVQPPKKEQRPKHGNSYSDTSTLDPRLRSGLEKAGFDVSDYDDRYLKNIQVDAMDIASGFKLNVSGKLKPLVDWAVRHLYKDVPRLAPQAPKDEP